MATGNFGTFLISWAQTELDGLVGTDPADIAAGSTWRWTAPAIRVDDPRDILVLEHSEGSAKAHRSAAAKLRRFLGDPNLLLGQADPDDADQPLFRYGFEVTDGVDKFQASFVQIESGQRPMLLFIGVLPPVGQDLWVLSVALPNRENLTTRPTGGTICFATTTRIKTSNGPIPVEDLREGDLICTKDNGVQAIRWVATRLITGGRLMAIPQLRPIKFRADVLEDGEPDKDLIVSPDHRVLLKGPVAQALFNTPEVLVAARDLVNDTSIRVDHRCRQVAYVHLMLDQHQIVWANGVQVESFHPAAMDTKNIDPKQRARLWERFPQARSDAFSYGEFARRNLTRSEAALMSFGVFDGH